MTRFIAALVKTSTKFSFYRLQLVPSFPKIWAGAARSRALPGRQVEQVNPTNWPAYHLNHSVPYLGTIFHGPRSMGLQVHAGPKCGGGSPGGGLLLLSA